MNRRELLVLVGSAMAAARPLRAQQKAMPVIGYLSSTSPTAVTFPPFQEAFLQGLSEKGYVDGRNVVIEYRFAEGRLDRLPALAADLVDKKVDLILASGGLTTAPPCGAGIIDAVGSLHGEEIHAQERPNTNRP